MLGEVRGKRHELVSAEVEAHQGGNGFKELYLDAVDAVVGQVELQELGGVLEPGGLEDRQLVSREYQTLELLETYNKRVIRST